jgi:hypothetical protein
MQDALIGWLREVGELSDAELAAQFDQSAHQRLVDLARYCVEGVSVPVDLTADEFAQWVRDLRRSHFEWNRALGQALLDAEDAQSKGDKGTAVQVLTEFASACSWLTLRDISEGEAQRHGST